ncbi:MAG: hypothetical protein MJ169_00535 [Treponema sp.]|nr:hypothetical protein [Treponema sp.]
MNAKKLKTAVLLFLLTCCGLFSANSQNSSAQLVRSTEHFDIIYYPVSERTAVLFEENIEKMYLDIRKRVQAENFYHLKRFPIFIEYTTQSLNGYFQNDPFHKIVIFDTPPTQSLAVFDNTILSVLDHELTHAVTLNVKTKFNKVIADIFTDSWSGITFSAPAFLQEGISVLNESRDGTHGRLNDGFSTHILKQAKIDGQFLNWDQATGARDIFPSGNVPYMYGGAFSSFLVNKYGVDKYYQYWDSLVDQPLWYFYTYDKYFGTRIDDDWKEFCQSIDVSSIKDIDSSKIADFTRAKETTAFTGVTSWLKPGEGGTAWIDTTKRAVYYSSRKDGMELDYSNPKKLFTLHTVQDISFSRDGRFLAFSYLASYGEYKNRSGVYDMQTKQIKLFDEDGLREACVIKTGNEYVFAALKVLGQKSDIQLYKMKVTEKSSSIEKKPYKILDFKDNVLPLSLCDSGRNSIAFIRQEGTKQAVVIYDSDFESNQAVEIPSQFRLRYLEPVIADGFVTDQDGLLFTFSYCQKERIPSLGFVSVKYAADKPVQSNFYLQKEEISGGVWYPAAYPSSKSQKLPSVIYSAHFFDHSRLYVMDTDSFDFDVIRANITSIDESYEAAQVDRSSARKLNPFEAQKYYFRGALLPLGTTFIYDSEFNATDVNFLGITYYGRNFTFSPGFAPFSLSYGGLLRLFNSTETGNASYDINTTAFFDELGFKQTTITSDLKAAIPVGTHSYISMYNATKVFYGYSNVNSIFAFKTMPHDNLTVNAVSKTGINWQVTQKTGSSPYQKFAFAIGPSVTVAAKFMDLNTPSVRDAYGWSTGFDLHLALPQLLPIDCQKGFTYNLPLTATVNMFPNIDRMLSANAELVLFGMEIHETTGHFILPVYFNRFSLSATYNCNLFFNRYLDNALFNLPVAFNSLGLYKDQIGLKMDLYFTINTGNLQKIGAVDFAAEFLFDLNNPSEKGFSIKLFNQLVF